MKQHRVLPGTISAVICIIPIFLISLLSATQVVSHLINPQIGENLWQMNYRQSITQDDIINTVTLSNTCDFYITQDDIDNNGGGFTITQAGNWCVSEDLFTSQPITISTSPGLLDLRGRTITTTISSSTVPSTPYCVQVASSQGVVIRNGNIVCADLAGGGARTAVFISGSKNCLVDSINVTSQASVDNP